MKQKKPWVECRACSHPINPTNPEGVFDGEFTCVNPTCPFSPNGVVANIAPSHEEAELRRAQDRKQHMLLGDINNFRDITDQPTQYWGYFRLSDELRRFRLLDAAPLYRLLPQGMMSDWAYGVAERIKRAFSLFLVDYNKQDGEPERAPTSGYVKLEPVAPDETTGRTLPIRYDPVCKLVNKHLRAKREANPEYPDPCRVCNEKLANWMFDRGTGEKHMTPDWLRKAAADPKRGIEEEHMGKFHAPCWLGLLDMAFPVIIADVVVAVVFTGQIRLDSVKLSTEAQSERSRILAELAITDADIAKLNPMFDDPKIVGSLWKELRGAARELQMVAVSRYVQVAHARSSVLQDFLRAEVFSKDITSAAGWTAYREICLPALERIAQYFSFEKAALFVNDGQTWNIAAAFPPKEELPTSCEFPIDTKGVHRFMEDVWGESGPADAFYQKIPAGDTAYYLFCQRRFPGDSPMQWMNVYSQESLSEITRGFHSALQRALLQQRQEEQNVQLVHNLKGPINAMESAWTEFDNAIFYNDHYRQKYQDVCKEYSFLKRELDKLYTMSFAARRRALAEFQRINIGAESKKTAMEGARWIPISDSEHDPSVDYTCFDPGGLREMLLWSFLMYKSEILAHAIGLEKTFNESSLKGLKVRINKDTMQMVFDNLADNAVKYSYPGEKIKIQFEVQEENGKRYCAISIWNYGNGTDDSEREEELWKKRKRGRFSTTKKWKVAGSGLGLYIVARTIKEAGGWRKLEGGFGGATNRIPGEGMWTKVTVALPITT